MWKSQCNVVGLFMPILIWIDSSDRQQEYSPTLHPVEASGALETKSPYAGLGSVVRKETREAEWRAWHVPVGLCVFSFLGLCVRIYDFYAHSFNLGKQQTQLEIGGSQSWGSIFKSL